MTRSLLYPAGVIALLALTGCTAVLPDRASPLPTLVRSSKTGEMNIFVYTDRNGATDVPDRQGYNLSFPVLDQ